MSVRRFGRYRVELTNLDRLYFPEAGLTKGDLVAYYEDAGELMLPGLRGRALSLERYPEGLDGEGFYQKRVSPHFPSWLQRVSVPSEDEPLEQPIASNRTSLVYLAGQGTVAFHPWLSRADALEHPDQLIIDLDPSTDDFEPVRRAAFRLRELLDEIDLASYVRLTGSRGVHVVSPLDRAASFDEVRPFAREIAGVLASRAPKELTVEVRKEKRSTRVFVDWLRNGYAQTAVASYSVRARPTAPVATPVTWEELEDPALGPRHYHLGNIRERLKRVGDPWRGMRRHARSITKPRQRLARLLEDAGG